MKLFKDKVKLLSGDPILLELELKNFIEKKLTNHFDIIKNYYNFLKKDIPEDVFELINHNSIRADVHLIIKKHFNTKP